MKKKMVIKVSTNGAKARSKALKIAVSIPGVESAAMGEKDKNQIVVGEGVDPVKLTRKLRKKLSSWPHLACFLPNSKWAYAELVSVANVETKSQPTAQEKPQEANQNPIVWQCPPPSIPQHVHLHEDPCTCSIL